MTFRMIAQLWNTNTPAIVSCDADLTENYMKISMKFRTGVHVFSWEVGVFNRSFFQSVSCNKSWECICCPVHLQLFFFSVCLWQIDSNSWFNTFIRDWQMDFQMTCQNLILACTLLNYEQLLNKRTSPTKKSTCSGCQTLRFVSPGYDLSNNW